MKLLVTSIDALVNSESHKFFSGITKELNAYLELSSENRVAVISVHDNKLKGIPSEFNPMKIPFKLRGKGPELLNFINGRLGQHFTEAIILGAKDHDMYTAAHTNSIFLTALYAKKNNPSDKIYKKGYGIPLAKVSSIGMFLESSYNIKSPWYFKVNVDSKMSHYALTNANTWGLQGKPLEVKDNFRECLKNDNDTYIVPFTCYFLVSAHRIIKELSEFDYWDIYPSSTKSKENIDLLYFARKAAHSFNKTFHDERLLIRHTDTSKRHSMTKTKRIEIGCDQELKTMIINPNYKGKIEGKSIAIIDDFTRIGTSSETARILLRSAGVENIVFISMGKFGTDREYHKYTYKIEGSPYEGLKAEQKSLAIIEGELNNKSNKEFIDSLSKII